MVYCHSWSSSLVAHSRIWGRAGARLAAFEVGSGQVYHNSKWVCAADRFQSKEHPVQSWLRDAVACPCHLVGMLRTTSTWQGVHQGEAQPTFSTALGMMPLPAGVSEPCMVNVLPAPVCP